MMFLAEWLPRLCRWIGGWGLGWGEAWDARAVRLERLFGRQSGR